MRAGPTPARGPASGRLPRIRGYNSTMYAIVLLLHSWLRWAVLLLCLVALVRAIDGMRTRRAWDAGDERVTKLFVIALDLQMLIGLVLYFLFSPLTKAALSDFAGAMRDPILRYWAVEHPFGMVVAIALVHVGRARARRAADAALKHRRTAVFFILALIAMLAAIPWPGTPNARPLLRW